MKKIPKKTVSKKKKLPPQNISREIWKEIETNTCPNGKVLGLYEDLKIRTKEGKPYQYRLGYKDREGKIVKARYITGIYVKIDPTLTLEQIAKKMLYNPEKYESLLGTDFLTYGAYKSEEI